MTTELTLKVKSTINGTDETSRTFNVLTNFDFRKSELYELIIKMKGIQNCSLPREMKRYSFQVEVSSMFDYEDVLCEVEATVIQLATL